MKCFSILVLFLLLTGGLFAQIPQGFNYQGVARNEKGEPIPKGEGGVVTIRIMEGANEVYSESHSIRIDNNFGLYTLTIGKGKEALFKNIKWETGNKHIEVIAKFEGAPELKSPLIPLLTVPYAMYAAKSGSSVNFKNGSGIRLDFDATTQTYTITNTGDLDPADDITKTTQAGGDLTGIYPSPTIRDNAITNNKIATGTISADKLQQSGATNGQVLRWDGAKWAPATGNTPPGPAYKAGLGIEIDANNTITNTAPDRTVTLKGEGGTTIKGQYPDFTINSSTVPGTNYTAGKGISITAGNVIENTGDIDANDDVIKSAQAGGDVTGTFADLQLKPGAVTGPEIGNNAITSDKIANGSVSSDDLNPMNATTEGQVLKWQSGKWQAGTDIVGVPGTNPEGIAPIVVSGNKVSIPKATGAADGYLAKEDWNTFSGKENALSFDAPSGLSRTGNTVRALNANALWNANQLQGRNITIPAGAITPNYVLKWTGAAWEPKPDETGTGSGVTAEGATTGFVPLFKNANTIVNSTILNNGGGLLVQGQQGEFDYEKATNSTRLMWIPELSAFRVGTVDVDTEPDPDFDGRRFWDKLEIGQYSVAIGRNNKARGKSTTAIGNRNEAYAVTSTALGTANKVLSGYGGMAAGFANTVQDRSGKDGGSYAFGWFNEIDGTNSTAIGRGNKINESFSVALGLQNEITKGNAVAIGSCMFANDDGAVLIGDASFDPNQNSEVELARGKPSSSSWGKNTMTMRFAGGYRFYTSKDGSTLVSIPAGANGTVTLSDVRKKENFKQINGEEMLKKIGRFTLTTWNYKGQDARLFRHYGPMAQDFYKAFGNDGVGVIGTDTTIASADFDGINFTAIKALVDRTDELRQKDQQLEQKTKELDALLRQLNEQKAETQRLQTELIIQKEQTAKLHTDLELIKQHLGIGLQSQNGLPAGGMKK